ncbi:MAG TPA: hypothetical protein VGH56_00370, partial [Solirubrobacteraceae bacterium]
TTTFICARTTLKAFEPESTLIRGTELCGGSLGELCGTARPRRGEKTIEVEKEAEEVNHGCSGLFKASW